MNTAGHVMDERLTGDDWLTGRRFAALMALVICVTFAEVVFGLTSFAYRDFGLFGAPLAAYHRECFWRGEVPLVNPFNNCGLPFLAQWNTLTCYPLSLIYLLLPFPWSLNLFTLAHLWLAGVAMYFLAFRWTGHRLAAAVAGVAFALNGLTLHALMWPNNLAALGWMPLVVLWVERAGREGGRAVCVAGLVGALQMLTGAPEIIGFTWLIAGVLALGTLARIFHIPHQPATLCRRRRQEAKLCSPSPAKPPHVGASSGGEESEPEGGTTALWQLLRRLAATGALVAGLAAVQLLPFVELLAHSQRDRAFGGDAWAMPGWGWANFLVPLFRCTPSMHGVYSQDAQQWTSSYYVGIGVLALGVLAVLKVRRAIVWTLAALALAGAWLALGNSGGLLAGLKWLVPSLGWVRFPIKWVVVTVFALPLLAAFGLAWWRTPFAPGRSGLRRSLVQVGLTLLVAVMVVVAFALWFPFPKEDLRTTLWSGGSRAVLLVLVLAAFFGWARARTPRQAGWLGAGLLAVLILDALTHTPRSNPTVPVTAYRMPAGPTAPRLGESRAMISPAMQRFLDYAGTPDLGETFRGQQQALFGNCNLLARVPKVNGFYSLYLKAEAQVQALLYASTNPPPDGLLDFLGVAQISAPDDGFAWQHRETALPMVTAGQRPVFADEPTTLGLLASPEFEPRQVVYLPPEARGAVRVQAQASATVNSAKFAAGRIEWVVEAEAPALVVIAQAFHRPWKAQVDGRPVPLWRANHAFQALEVPAGPSQVTLVYRDTAFVVGLLVSSFTLLLCGFFYWQGRRRTSLEDSASTPRSSGAGIELQNAA
jgi:hypothetical protein